MNEIKRQESKRKQILNALRKKPQTNKELSEIALRYGGHLGNLYQLGYKISKESLGDGLYRYTLTEEPKEENHDRQKAKDRLISEIQKEEIIDADMFENMLDKLGITIKYKAGTYNAI